MSYEAIVMPTENRDKLGLAHFAFHLSSVVAAAAFVGAVKRGSSNGHTLH